MKLERAFYDLTYQVHWDNEAEENRARAFPPASEMIIMMRIAVLKEEIVLASIDEPGEDGLIRKANLNVMQGRLLELQQLLSDSQEANAKLGRADT
jgi:hypothetical protein